MGLGGGKGVIHVVYSTVFLGIVIKEDNLSCCLENGKQ